MKIWEFDWNGHHFEVELDQHYGPAGLWRTSESILRVDGRKVDRQTSTRPWLLYIGHQAPTLTTAIVGEDGKTYSIRVDFGIISDCRVLAEGNEVFKA